ncbi:MULTISPECIES: sensor domain-containing diguanylate cyclase [unclassified Shewanella]|jgi:diguanylate cyclase (GGDEF)-like protein/PAS domain S-box-containing protein|uniref:sensor domain-containing diguanylate cyclase n=1 Tax=unclassified Shewanella TaxID=196818 RepID=UPI001E5731E7|nr:MULTISPECIES: sensor domain-containing diguanylate cyclase [unclassified Shewanella]
MNQAKTEQAKLQKMLSTLEQENNQLRDDQAELVRQNAVLQEKLNAALDGTGLCLWEQHIPSGNLTMFNMEWGSLLGYTIDELAAHVDSWKGNLHPEDRDWVVANFDDHVKGKTDSYQVTHRMLHKDGSVSWVSDRGRIVEFDEHGHPIRIMGTHIDITQEKRYEMGLAELAHKDPLTGLLNRKALMEAFEQSKLQQGAGGALLFIDLDDFKANNDHYGHKFGDSLLIRIANILTSYLGQTTDIARLGGDEFVVLYPSKASVQLETVANAMLQLFAQPLNIENHSIKVGLSIGIAVFGKNELFSDVYEQADKAMYQVKRQGKNCFLLCS